MLLFNITLLWDYTVPYPVPSVIYMKLQIHLNSIYYDILGDCRYNFILIKILLMYNWFSLYFVLLLRISLLTIESKTKTYNWESTFIFLYNYRKYTVSLWVNVYSYCSVGTHFWTEQLVYRTICVQTVV